MGNATNSETDPAKDLRVLVQGYLPEYLDTEKFRAALDSKIEALILPLRQALRRSEAAYEAAAQRARNTRDQLVDTQAGRLGMGSPTILDLAKAAHTYGMAAEGCDPETGTSPEVERCWDALHRVALGYGEESMVEEHRSEEEHDARSEVVCSIMAMTEATEREARDSAAESRNGERPSRRRVVVRGKHERSI